MPSSDTAVRPVTTPQQTTTSVPAPTTPTTSRWAWRDWLCLALLAGGVLLTYSEIFSCGFVNYDDGQYVTQNPTVLSGLTVSGFRLAWTTAYAANWHPLTWLSLMLDATMFGREAWGFHLTNVLLHICNTLLLFIIFRWLTGAVWRSAFVAALFGVHPLHVEAVAWISERKEVLSAFFGLLALLAYAFYVQRPSIRRYLLVALGMVFSLLAKPMWVTLPAMLLLLDYWPLRRWPLAAQGASKRVSFKWLLLEKTPLALLSVATVPITLWAQQTGGALRSLAHVPFSQRLANSLVSYGEYLRQLVWPRDLACFYPYPQHGVSIALTVTIAVLLVLVTVAVLRWSRKCPYLPVGWLWYLGTLVPVLGLVTIGLAARADRYTYVPFIGIFVALVWGTADLAQWVGHARRAAAVGCAIVVSCMLLSWVQVQVWADSITLWTHDIAVVGGTDIGHSNLASAYEAVGNVKEAVKQYEAAIACNRDYAPAHGALGLLWLHHGQPAKAAEQFKAALRTDPEPARSHANLGQALLQQGEVDEAVREFKETLRLRPQDRATRLVLAGTLFHGGHVDEAAQLLDEGIRLDPDAAELQQLRGVIYLQGRLMRQAEAYFHRAAELRPDNALYHRSHAYTLNALGRPEEAKAEYQESVRLDPNWPKLALTRAWLLSTAPDGSQRDAATAVLEAEQGRQAMGDQDPHVLDILAAAYANAGRFPEAVAAARLAKARAEALQQTEFATELGRRLRLFEHKQPFRTAAPPSANLPPSR